MMLARYLLFHLQQQHLIELIREQKVEEALQFAAEHLAERGEEDRYADIPHCAACINLDLAVRCCRNWRGLLLSWLLMIQPAVLLQTCCPLVIGSRWPVSLMLLS